MQMAAGSLDLTPGLIYEFADLRELPAFEDALVEQVNPDLGQAMRIAWAGQVALTEILRPSRINNKVPFNGRVTDIMLQIMDDPQARFLDARDRGFEFTRGHGRSVVTQDERALKSLVGFAFLGNAHVTGHGVIGQVQAEIWYRRVRSNTATERRIAVSGDSKSYTCRKQDTTYSGGMGVYRYATKVKIEPKKFIAVDAAAKRIGFNTLRRALLNPIDSHIDWEFKKPQ